MRPHHAIRKFSTTSGPADPTKIDFAKLGFNYIQTKSVVFYDYEKDKGWSKGRLGDPYMEIHIMSNVFHYGQGMFEGFKAFHKKDGYVSTFNSDANWNRMHNGAERIGMPQVPKEIFDEAVTMLIKDNLDYVPPYGSGGSLYVRPVLFGHGAKMGLGIAPQFTFAMLCCPVGTYFKAGEIIPLDALVPNADRAAPNGVGNVKVAGNYAADVKPAAVAASQGYQSALYLDAKTNSYIEEFSSANFIGISKDQSTYVTPDSNSILPSITNAMLQQLARDKGMKVEKRPVKFDEVRTFSEIGSCGTAVIVSPIRSITRNGEKIHIGDKYPVLQGLHSDLTNVQSGETPDVHGWHRNIAKK